MTVLALDIGGTSIKAALISEDGTLSNYKEFPSNGSLGGEALMQSAFKVAAAYAGYNRIGISVTGQVNSDDGVILFANDNIPNFTGTPVGRLFRQAFGVPVKVENDGNAMALGEIAFAPYNHLHHVICVVFGTGVGGALFLNGCLYKGSHYSAGEIGHIIVHANGLPCSCGQYGCYEQYASVNALVKKAQSVDATFSNGRQVIAEYLSCRPEIVRIVDEWVDEITFGLTTLAHIFQPEAFILGGGVMEQKHLITLIQAKMQGRVMPCYQDIAYLPAVHGNKAALLGVTHAAFTSGCDACY